MPEQSDPQLLAAYIGGSHDAFRALVDRYASLIYAVAQRQAPVCLAEDITQAVFLLLAQRAKTIRHPHLLSAWLLKVSHYCAADARRSASRRQKHEQKAAAMAPTTITDLPTPEADPLDAHLHSALERLSPIDRTAILLRYFRNQSVAEIALALNTSEESAKKRVSRAVEKLRQQLLRKNTTLALPILAATFAKQASAAPPTLAAKIAAAAFTKTSTTTTAALIAKGAAKLMAYTTAKVAAAATVGIVLIAATAAHFLPTPSPLPPAVALAAAPPPASSPVPTEPIIHTTPSVRIVPRDPVPTIEVRDLATNAPLAGAHVEVTTDETYHSPISTGTTGLDGTITMPYPPGVTYGSEVIASAPGYVPTLTYWSRQLPADTAPSHFSLRLEKAIPVGGRVVDFGGKPLQGATVHVIVQKRYDTHTLVADIPNAITDTNGDWTLNAVPEKGDLFVGASHPLCLNGSEQFSTNRALLSELRTHSHLVRLQRGIPVTGTLFGPDGQPHSGSIAVGLFSGTTASIPEFQILDDGHFEFAISKDMPILALTAHAKGFAYATSVTRLEGTPVHVDIHLSPQKPLTAHIVDPHGTPISNALVVITSWNTGGPRLKVGSMQVDRPQTFPVALVSDANGNIQWNEAPAQPVLAKIIAAGCLWLMDFPLNRDTSNPITLIPQPLIRVHAVSAENGRPLTDFWMTPWDADECRTMPDGSVEFTEFFTRDRTVPPAVTGEHYFSEPLPPITFDGNDYDITMPLSEGDRITGTLVDAQGSPLAGIRLGITPDHSLENFPFDAASQENQPHNYATSDKDGNFSFPPQASAYSLFASTDHGYAFAPSTKFEGSHTLTLFPWGTLQGALPPSSHGNVAGISLFMMRIGSPSLSYNAVTDASGHFIIPQVAAGNYDLTPTLEDGTHPTTKLKIRAGQTTTVITRN